MAHFRRTIQNSSPWRESRSSIKLRRMRSATQYLLNVWEGLTPQNIKLKIIFYYNLPTDSKKRTTRQSKTQNAMQVTTSDQHLPVLGPALQKTSAAKPKELSPS